MLKIEGAKSQSRYTFTQRASAAFSPSPPPTPTPNNDAPTSPRVGVRCEDGQRLCYGPRLTGLQA